MPRVNPRPTAPPTTPVAANATSTATATAAGTGTDIAAANPPAGTAGPDRYDGADPHRPVATSAINIPRTALGRVGDQDLLIASDGRIGSGAPPAGEADELKAAIHLGVNTAADANAFAGVADKAVLRGVSQRLVQAHRSWCRDTTSETERLELRQGRAAALMLLEDAALRAGELGDTALRNELARSLATAIGGEPFRAVRDFACNAYDRMAQDQRLPADKMATEAIFPSTPPYDKWLKDRTIKIHFIVDNDGSTLSFAVSTFRAWGMEKKYHRRDGSYTFTLPKYGARPAIEITIPKPADKAKGEKPELFGKMNDPDVDVICYFGHAGYGHRVDHALATGVGGTGDGKLVLLAQCWGEGNIESLERAYPDAQMLSTTEKSSDTLDYVMFDRLLEGFQARESWQQIESGIEQKLKYAYGDYPPIADDYNFDEHYFTPITRTVLQKHYDRDGDGVADAQDNIFNVVYPKRLDAAGGYDPVAQATPDYALDGQALSKAINGLSLTLRYAKMLTPAQEARVPWQPDALVPGGFFDPEAGDLRAFRLVEDAATHRVQVQLSTRFSHTSEKDLSRMLAFEAGLWYGERAGLDDTGRVALGLAMLERSIHQQGDWYWSSGLLEEPWAEESFLLQRYRLEPASFAGVVGASGNPDDFLPEHFKKIADYVKQQPGLAGAARAAPQLIGSALDVPDGVRLPARGIDKSVLQLAVERLGLTGTVESFSPSWLSDGQPNNLACVVRAADGTTRVLGLGVDSEGMLRSASTLTLRLDSMKEQGARQHLEELASRCSVPLADLQTAYDRARQSGQSIALALAEVYRALRPRTAPGTDVPRLNALVELEKYGLADPAEWRPASEAFERLFAQGSALKAERDFMEWARGVTGVDAAALDRLYLGKLDGDPVHGGPAAGVTAVLEALPRPLPAATQVFDLVKLLASGLIAPLAMPGLTRLCCDRLGATPATLARDAVLAGLPWSASNSDRQAALSAFEADRTARAIKEVILHMARAAKESGGVSAVPSVNARLLEQMGILSAGDAQLVDAGLAELKRA
ncbi:MAG: hypothetical protein JXR83_19740 [Deltaproteobacteria bacterium]|nr:hypothetical protein [Deltaproteobacteria bacterium]